MLCWHDRRIRPTMRDGLGSPIGSRNDRGRRGQPAPSPSRPPVRLQAGHPGREYL
jgi:hypothetical protein